MEPAWITWIRDISDHAPDRQVANRIGIAPSTVGRWQEYPPKVDAVVKLAHAYGVPVADGLIAAGYVQAGDLRTPRYERDLSRFTASELLAELTHRVTADGQQLHERINSPTDYGEEPDPSAYDLAAGHLTRPNNPR